MKIKFTLARTSGTVDLSATVEATATVGDLATHLLATDPTRRATPKSLHNPTLSLAGGPTLDPRQPLADSPFASGATLSLLEAGRQFVDDQQQAAAIVRVVEGPDAGREFPIGEGSAIIGRDRGIEVRLSDPMASRRHARINVGAAIEIIDLGSANGVQIDEIAVPRAMLRAGDVVQIGDTKLTVSRTSGRPNPAQSGVVAFVRSPRLDPVYEGVEYETPEPPERARSTRFPAVALLAPLLMGALLYLITKSLTSIVFVALSPLMLVGSAIESRLSGASEYKRAVKAFRADVADLADTIRTAQQAEVSGRRAESPSTAELIAAVNHRSALMWTRRVAHRGYGELTLGHGRLASRNSLAVPAARRSSRDLASELIALAEELAAVDDVPVVADLNRSALGLAGPRPQVLPVARALVSQAVALHSPSDLVVVAVLGGASAADWDWLKWLPHTSETNAVLNARPLCSAAGAAMTLIDELEDLVERRGADEDDRRPSVLLVVEADAPVEHGRLAALAAAGPAVGLFVIWSAPDTGGLPNGCEIFVELGRDGVSGLAGYVHTGTAVEPVRLETLDARSALATARDLARIVDLDALTDDASDLPRAVSLLALSGPELANSPEAVLERWTENRSIVRGPLAPAEAVRRAGSLRAVVGQSATETFAIDLRADGPHALVGGTTGSGKSELLQAWILAMAAAHSPQRLTFLLVDYKGGAAFSECEHLPHTVGLVTDLSPARVRRALTSLTAEVAYRERLLHRHGAKDLIDLERRGVAETPPSLVLVVDEFAALVTDVPEFVDGVVNIAQRGRSLGIHLILATQRPAGVIKDNLRANTNLRIALRMADEADSADVLGSTDAAYFDSTIPGRAMSKMGPGRLVAFQTGYAGGWTDNTPPPPEILVEELGLGTPTIWTTLEPAPEPVDSGPTDITRLVRTVSEASRAAEIEAPRKAWLPELLATYDLGRRDHVPTSRRGTELVFGVRDDPMNQAQPTVAFLPDRDGNLIVHGTGGSGKSAALRTLTIAAGFSIKDGPCWVYALDFAGRSLDMLSELPHVGSVIPGADHERLTRLLTWLRGTIDERRTRYSAVNADTITEYRRVGQRPEEPRILLLVDGINAFRSAYESADRLRWFDLFVSIAAEGRAAGIQVIISSDQRGGLPTSLQSALQSRLVLRMASSDDYGMLGVPGDVLSATSPPGRGIMADAEVQVAVLGGDPDVGVQAREIREFAAAMRNAGTPEAPPVRSLDSRIPLVALPALVDGLPVVGLASATLGPAVLDVERPVVICGPPGSGRSTALRTVIEAIQRWKPGAEFHYYGNRRSELADLPLWRNRSLSPDDAAIAAAELTAGLAYRSSSNPIVLILEGIGDYANSLAETALQQLIKQCAADGHPVIAEGESSAFGSGMGMIGALKSARNGIALAPDPGDGPTIFKTQFPRFSSGELPPGRGVVVRVGRAEVVQVAQSGG